MDGIRDEMETVPNFWELKRIGRKVRVVVIAHVNWENGRSEFFVCAFPGWGEIEMGLTFVMETSTYVYTWVWKRNIFLSGTIFWWRFPNKGKGIAINIRPHPKNVVPKSAPHAISRFHVRVFSQGLNWVTERRKQYFPLQRLRQLEEAISRMCGFRSQANKWDVKEEF